MLVRFILILTLFLYAYPAYAVRIKVVESEAGTKAWLAENHNLHIITSKIAFKGCGSANDENSVSGLSNMTAQLLTEGTRSLPGNRFKEKLSDYAIDLSFFVDKDNFYAVFKTLSHSRDTAMSLLLQSLLEPELERETIKRIKEEILTVIDKKEESPEHLAKIEWDKAVFKSHPYSQPIYGRKESVSNITKAHVENFIKRCLTRSNIFLSFVGDTNEKELSDLLSQHIDKISSAPSINHAVPEFSSFPEGQTIVIERPFPQSVVEFGTKGIKYKDPDFYPAHIMNYVLGGGSFESRLMNEIREKNGLVYSVFSYISPLDKTSVLEGFLATRNDKINDSIALLKNEISKMQKTGITEEELRSAKDYTIGSFALKMDSYEKLVHYLNFMQIEELGIDFLEKRNAMVEAVTLEDVNRVSQKLLDIDKFTIVIVGNKSP